MYVRVCVCVCEEAGATIQYFYVEVYIDGLLCSVRRVYLYTRCRAALPLDRANKKYGFVVCVNLENTVPQVERRLTNGRGRLRATARHQRTGPGGTCVPGGQERALRVLGIPPSSPPSLWRWGPRDPPTPLPGAPPRGEGGEGGVPPPGGVKSTFSRPSFQALRKFFRIFRGFWTPPCI